MKEEVGKRMARMIHIPWNHRSLVLYSPFPDFPSFRSILFPTFCPFSPMIRRRETDWFFFHIKWPFFFFLSPLNMSNILLQLIQRCDRKVLIFLDLKSITLTDPVICPWLSSSVSSLTLPTLFISFLSFFSNSFLSSLSSFLLFVVHRRNETLEIRSPLSSPHLLSFPFFDVFNPFRPRTSAGSSWSASHFRSFW